MIGAIRTWDIVSHPLVTIRCFGWRVFCRSVFTWNKVTFLSLLRDTDYFHATAPESSSVFQRCVDLELRAEEVYNAFAKKFVETRPASRFFKILALQEQEHAELLQICCATAYCNSKSNFSTVWHDRLPLLERQMLDVEAACRQVNSLDEALRLVIRIEACEINQIFLSLITATESEFVNRLSAFQKAMEAHLTFICRKIPEFSPDLAADCEELLAKFSWL
jgi:hypothetical protein